MAYTTEEMTIALSLLKTRLNRLGTLPADLETYLQARLESAYRELETVQGIVLELGEPNELMFLVDFAEWQYKNRDKPGAMPDWLRLQRREVFLAKQADAWKEANP